MGGGGGHTNGGGCAAAGGGSVRFFYTPVSNNLRLVIGGGMNTHYTSTVAGKGPNYEASKTFLYDGATIVAWAGGGGGSGELGGSYGITDSSKLIVGVVGPAGTNVPPAAITNGASLSRISGLEGGDFQASYGGHGQRLNGYCSQASSSNAGAGSGFGGGGGGENLNYGGTSDPGVGGNKGFAGSSNNMALDGGGYNAAIDQAGTHYGCLQVSLAVCFFCLVLRRSRSLFF